jgi:hypothetical protein
MQPVVTELTQLSLPLLPQAVVAVVAMAVSQRAVTAVRAVAKEWTVPAVLVLAFLVKATLVVSVVKAVAAAVEPARLVLLLQAVMLAVRVELV